MIYYLSRKEHQYTVNSIINDASLTLLDYDTALKCKKLPKGTYIFSDLDRLHPWDLELAAILFRVLEADGNKVLNDPAKVILRYNLLKRLENEGINQFGVYRHAAGEYPKRYPAFIRRDTFHEGVFSELLNNDNEVDACYSKLDAAGRPLNNLITVEYAAEEEAAGFFKKLSVYRIGDHYLRDTSVIQKDWIVKSGENGVAGEDYFADELAAMNLVPHEETIRRVFNLANIEYGRLDLGFYNGKPQVYEINTNPTVSSISLKDPSPSRKESRKIIVHNYLSALNAIDTVKAGPATVIRNDALRKRRKKSGLFQRSYPSI